MKEQIKLMKENATTPEDFEAIKDFKKQVKHACKENWNHMKEFKKGCKEYKKEHKKEHKHKDHKDKTDRFVAKHIADVTIPDHSELPADTPVTKTWRLRNVGVLAWPADSQLIFISRRGDNLNGPERVLVGAVEPQQDVDVSVTFITPSEPGRYIGYYRMATSEGAKFGQRVWVSFVVPALATRATHTTTTTTAASAPTADIQMD